MYADDVLLLSESGLQNYLDNLTEYCKRWRLPVNTFKTRTMEFNCRKMYITSNLEIIFWQILKRYLGFFITPSFKLKMTVKHMCDKANKSVFMLKSKTDCPSSISVSTYLHIFDIIIKYIM